MTPKELKSIYQAVIVGDSKLTKEMVRQLIRKGQDPEVILQDALIPAMDEVGIRYETGDFFVPEMLIAARAMQAAMSLLKPLLVKKKIRPLGKVVFGTVKGDIHDIGKNLVIMMMEGTGFEIKDLGVDVPPERFIEILRSDHYDIVALSALITTTLPAMKHTIDAISDAGLRNRIKIMVGGAPVTKAYAEEIGADGTAIDAGQAVKLAKSLIANSFSPRNNTEIH